MKVAFLANSFGRFGGREIQTAVIVNDLNSKNHDAYMYHSGYKLPLGLLQTLGTKYKALPLGLIQPFKTIRLLLELRNFDRIVNMGCEPLLAFVTLLFFGKKMVYYANSPLEVSWSEKITGKDYRDISKTFVGTVSMFYGKIGAILVKYRPTYLATTRSVALIDSISLRLYRSVWAVSKFSAGQIESFYHLPKGTVRTVYHMVRPDLMGPSQSKRTQLGSYVLAVGALVPEKNLTLLLEAVGKLRSKVRVVIAGQGPEKEHLLSLARKYGIDLSIEFETGGDGLAGLYANAILLVQPSFYECLSMVPVEAGLFGKPSIIVNSNYSGNSEIVIDGVTGFAIKNNSVSQLAEKIEFLLNNPEERVRLGSNAQKVVSELFMSNSGVIVDALKFE
jgi:glycosyltransferase involved in cell wall biosynthesis